MAVRSWVRMRSCSLSLICVVQRYCRTARTPRIPATPAIAAAGQTKRRVNPILEEYQGCGGGWGHSGPTAHSAYQGIQVLKFESMPQNPAFSRIRLKNVRCFRETEIQFDRRVT